MSLKDRFNKERKTPQPNSSAPASGTPPIANPRNTGNFQSVRSSGTYQPVSSGAPGQMRPDQEKLLQELAWQQSQDFSRAGQNEPDETSAKLTGLEGEVINGLYRIECLLAEGGMGQLFRAFHTQREITIVLKLMKQQVDRNDPGYNRFLQECMITGRLRHPNLVKVLDYGILLDGLKPYLVMEYVEGLSMREVLKEHRTMTPLQISQLLVQACRGLEEVHKKDIIHRDLKPENLMVQGNYDLLDNVKILDFGIAQLNTKNSQKMNEEGVALGSVGYMSPEQICAHPVDLRTDIYSLGIIFYEAICGVPPFKGATVTETMAMHVKAPPMPPSMMVQLESPKWVDRIVANCLAKDPNRRYPDVEHLRQDLEYLVKMSVG